MKEKVMNKVDQLGMLLAQIADLEIQAELLKNEIKNEGEGHYDGELFRACVTLSQRNTVDHKAVYKALNVPELIIAQNTKSTAVITLKITGRE
jgi:hypothetical protein